MQFVRILIEDVPHIYMDLEGLKLGMRDAYQPGEIPLSEDEVNRLMEYVAPFQTFKVSTYKVLKDKATTLGWDFVFGQVNPFLRSLKDDERRVIAETMLTIHCDILEHMALGSDLTNKLLPLTQQFSRQIAEMDRRIDLMPKLEIHVRKYIPIPKEIPETETSTDKHQHTPKLTFTKEHVTKLTTCGLLCKMLCPILGAYIESCKKQIDSTLKDLHCFGMLKDILDYRYQELILKFQHFITNIVTKELQRNVKIKTILNAHTVGMVSQQQVASAFVRNFVRVNFFKPNSNLMIVVTSSCRNAIQQPPSSGTGKYAIEELHGPQEMIGSDEGNMTALECGAQSSLMTVDIPHLIKLSVNKLIENLIIEYDLDREEVEETWNYYRRNLFPISPLNIYLIAIAYGSELGGAKSVPYLSSDHCLQLIALLQFRMATMPDMADLAVAMSLEPSDKLKVIQTKKDGILKSSWNTSAPYRACLMKYQITCGDLYWHTQIQEIVQWILGSNFLIRLSEPLETRTGYVNKDGQFYEYPDTLVQQICQFVLIMLHDRWDA